MNVNAFIQTYPKVLCFVHLCILIFKLCKTKPTIAWNLWFIAQESTHITIVQHLYALWITFWALKFHLVQFIKPLMIFSPSTDRISVDLSNEIKRLQRLNKLQLDSGEDSSKDSSSSQDSGPESPDSSSRVARLIQSRNCDRPLYTLKQVMRIIIIPGS